MRHGMHLFHLLCCGGIFGVPLQAQGLRLEPLASTTSNKLFELGVVADAAADAQGRIYILDSSLPLIVITDDRLQPIGSFGRRGSGPGEFRDPVSIAVLTGNRLAVLDRGLGRVTVLQSTDDGKSLEPLSTLLLRMSPAAMCVLAEDRLLVHGFREGDRLHVFDLNGRLSHSFAPTDPAFSPMAHSVLTQGPIVYGPQEDEVLVSNGFLPLVETFSIATWERTWADSLAPFRHLTIADRGGSFSIESGNSGHSVVTNVLNIGDYRAFQTVYGSRTDGVEVDTVVTYVYSKGQRVWMPSAFNAPLLFKLDDTTVLSVSEGAGFELDVVVNRIRIGG